MIAQVINTGTDVGQKHFDIQIPGGGFGIFDGCSKDGYNEENKVTWEPQHLRGRNGYMFSTSKNNFGARYGGVWDANKDCHHLPSAIRSGCNAFKSFASNNKNTARSWTNKSKSMDYKYVACPSDLVKRSECQRNGI